MYAKSMKNANDKCAAMRGKPKAACMQNVQVNKQWLAKNLRAQDKPFQEQYVGVSHKYAKQRKHYLSKRKDIATAYKAELTDVKAKHAKQHADRSRKVSKRLREQE